MVIARAYDSQLIKHFQVVLEWRFKRPHVANVYDNQTVSEAVLLNLYSRVIIHKHCETSETQPSNAEYKVKVDGSHVFCIHILVQCFPLLLKALFTQNSLVHFCKDEYKRNE